VRTAVRSADASHPIRLTVNGRPEEIRVSTRRSLLQALREDLHLTGAKEGCGLGTCGACTVLVDGNAVLSCLLLAVQAHDRSIETIEGVMQDDRLDPLQEAFIRHDAFQCGFCTPGQIMTLRGLLRRVPHPAVEEIRGALAGNVCRCGAYPRILTAVLDLTRRGGKAART
jgi:aerobic-type carbon monoxide dehydrogenase small subunit (CoxS/CutS family)